MKALYLDCFSGVSGDMALGALIDLGVDAEKLIKALNTLEVDGWSLTVERVMKRGVSASFAQVRLEDEIPHEESHPRSHEHMHEDAPHSHEDAPHSHEDTPHAYEHFHEKAAHSHDEEPTHSHAHSHVHRRHIDIIRIIDGSGLTVRAKRIAKDIFARVAAAEGKVHGVSPDEVQFHEVGAVDSIVDICGVAAAVDMLDVDRAFCSIVNDGHGFTWCQHGRIPVPVPAVVEIFSDPKVRWREIEVEKELVTPTGAAIVAALCEAFGLMPAMHGTRVGYGAGSRDLPTPNVLRAILGELDEVRPPERITVVESNIDDSTPEVLGYALEKLMESGARDAFFTPIQMKKNRPAVKLTALCAPDDAERMADVMFRETSTIGVRIREERRICLPREMITVHTRYGAVAVKKTEFEGQSRLSPEYSDARRLAALRGVPLRAIYEAVWSARLSDTESGGNPEV